MSVGKGRSDENNEPYNFLNVTLFFSSLQNGHWSSPTFAWDEARRAALRAELDAFFARAYGLTLDELRYILDPAEVMGPDYPSQTFRVLKEKEIRKHGEYRTACLVLEAWDRIEAGGEFAGMGM